METQRPGDRRQFDQWLDQRIDQAITGLLDEDRAVAAGRETLRSASGHTFLRDVFGVDTPDLLRASVAFNGLQERSRHAFMALVVEHRTVAECIEAGLGTYETLGGLVREGLRAITGREPAPSSPSANLGGDA